MGFLSAWHWIFILVVAVLLFGNRLPEVARSLGRSVNEFKKGLREVKDNFEDELNSDPPQEKLPPPNRERKIDSSNEVQREEEHAGEERE